MKVEVSENGLEVIYHPAQAQVRREALLLQAGVLSNDKARPWRVNIEALWLGNCYLRQDEVAELRDRLTAWLQTGSFRLEGEGLPTEGHGKARKGEGVDSGQLTVGSEEMGS